MAARTPMVIEHKLGQWCQGVRELRYAATANMGCTTACEDIAAVDGVGLHLFVRRGLEHQINARTVSDR